MTGRNEKDSIATIMRRWVETVVIDLNLCPFAGRELREERVRFEVTPANSEAELLACLQAELERLETHPEIETTLLIHPEALQDFADYNQFLDSADDLLQAMELTGTYQIASFHPDYQFADTAANDVENFTNRAPYPMLHLLREASVERAIGSHPDIEQIPQRNIRLMKELGVERLQQLLRDCFS